MGIFSRKPTSEKTTQESEKTTSIPWISISSESQIELIKNASKTNAVVIFKHSTRCGISRMVLKQFEALYKSEYSSIHFYYLDLLAYRHISDELASTFQVEHQSPQIIVLKNEVAVYDASHYEITAINFNRFL